jgi:hypothetical protein
MTSQWPAGVTAHRLGQFANEPSFAADQASTGSRPCTSTGACALSDSFSC